MCIRDSHGTPVTKPKLELIQTSAQNILRILDETLQHAKLEEHKVELWLSHRSAMVIDKRVSYSDNCVHGCTHFMR